MFSSKHITPIIVVPLVLATRLTLHRPAWTYHGWQVWTRPQVNVDGVCPKDACLSGKQKRYPLMDTHRTSMDRQMKFTVDKRLTPNDE